MKSLARHLMFACVIAILAFAAGAWASAQPSVVPQPVSPVIYSGADIGFRMTQRKGDTPVGELVVRVNGEWKPVQFAFGPRPLTR
jgi:hypothetical protein